MQLGKPALLGCADGAFRRRQRKRVGIGERELVIEDDEAVAQAVTHRIELSLELLACGALIVGPYHKLIGR